MAEERRFFIPGLLEEIPSASDFVTAAGHTIGLDDQAIYHVQLAVDEWCTNIIEHGFRGQGQYSRIEIVARIEQNQLTIIIADNGPHFDPTNLPEPNPTQSLEERVPGGLGWFFIRKVMNEVRYEYRDGRNYLTMTKHRIARPEQAKNINLPYPVELRAGGVAIIKPDGRLDSASGRGLEAPLLSMIDEGYTRIVLDMQHVTYISSVGLKALLKVMKRAKAAHGGLALSGLGVRVQEVFDMAGFNMLFTIVNTPEEALKAVGG
jgi:serine/threonine-protein kinase RsbW